MQLTCYAREAWLLGGLIAYGNGLNGRTGCTLLGTAVLLLSSLQRRQEKRTRLHRQIMDFLAGKNKTPN